MALRVRYTVVRVPYSTSCARWNTAWLVVLACQPFGSLAYSTLQAARLQTARRLAQRRHYSTIRMNSFAHLCSRLAEIKAIFDDSPAEAELYDAGTSRVVKVWTVSSLWSFIYYDFVPVLLGMVLMEFCTTLGWIDPPCCQNGNCCVLTPEQETNIFNRLFKAIEVYDNSVLLRSYIPNIKYAYATALFDFNPRLTVQWMKAVLEFLKAARFEAEKLSESGIGIYSITTCFSQIQSTEEFLSHVNRTINFIETEFGEELGQNDGYEIHTDRKLLLLNIEETVCGKF